MPDRVWGEGALIEFNEPRMTVFENGVALVVLATDSCNPDGEELKVRLTVIGWRSTLFVVVTPFESVAVRRSCRYDGYSWSGALNDPLATPGHVWTMCSWQLEGQCSIASVQLSADAGRLPSSVSLADPENEIRSPTFHVRLLAGLEIVGVGGVLPPPPLLHSTRANAQSPWSECDPVAAVGDDEAQRRARPRR